MSGRIHIGRIDDKERTSLAPEVQMAIMNVKNLGAGIIQLTQWGNAHGGPMDGPPLPKLSAGCVYREKDVGQARPTDPKGTRGKRRLVFEVHTATGKIMEIYYTEEHYAKGSFVRII